MSGSLDRFVFAMIFLFLFYQSVIQSTISFCICVWNGNLKAKDSHRLERVVKAASKTNGLDIKVLHCVFESAITSNKIQVIMQDPTHPLHSSVDICTRVFYFFLFCDMYVFCHLPCNIFVSMYFVRLGPICLYFIKKIVYFSLMHTGRQFSCF